MIKTVIRDVKRYMATVHKSSGQRQLPLGYSASNSRLILKSTFNYFTSGNKEEAVDFFCVRNPRAESMTLILICTDASANILVGTISMPISTGVANLQCTTQVMTLRFVFCIFLSQKNKMLESSNISVVEVVPEYADTCVLFSIRL